jgi:hypothetical protein
MDRTTILAVVLIVTGTCGCRSIGFKGSRAAEESLAASSEWAFRPVSMRVHPFTSLVMDRDIGLVLDARIELVDAMGDTSKGLGTFRFELYADQLTEGREGEGQRLYFWEGSVATLDETRQHYDSITRTYAFKLQLHESPQRNRQLRLAVQFDGVWGKRLTAASAIAPPRPPD